ncbi:hypothetical protein [Microseira wollei]|uniref:hypothetical protein n=1 Tax=Microseira wollei TaxID=467598 RepID=UPI001CFF1872|nr:hypothetical protein [Microseira wollei]
MSLRLKIFHSSHRTGGTRHRKKFERGIKLTLALVPTTNWMETLGKHQSFSEKSSLCHERYTQKQR